MTDKIRNGGLTAEVFGIGPELYSLQKDGYEYIWQRDPKFWTRCSPLLFPSVGRQIHDTYAFGNQKYRVGMHGIADYLETSLINKSDACLIYESMPTERVKKSYPFDFRIVSSFRLDEGKLSITRTVVNVGDTPLPFCIGEHTGFCCTDPENAVLRFERQENTVRAFLNDEHFINREELFTCKDIPLGDKQFLQGAWILREWKSDYISLIENERELLRVYRGDYPAVAIWRKPTAPFVCVEPIRGFDSDASDSKDFLVKKNRVLLDSGDQKSFSYSIMIK